MTVQLWEPESDADTIHPPTFAAVTFVLLVAVIAQVSVIARLPLPGGGPDLVLMLLATAALVLGPVNGAVLGFVTGLFGDLLSTHVLGQTTLVFLLVGYLVGLVADATERSAVIALAAVSGAVAVGIVADVAVAALLGADGLSSPGHTVVRALAAALYAALLTPFLFPVFTAGVRRTKRVGRR
ncbi:rod shape-determining protein MreD [Pseudofrankia inefficax]|uniref:Rod shape-determining protein MreD n=1 Tax=Pseudofrankia inefficax (strain DSM 45817 / CECT 9037 / DDB 130130 / EuI1c) TaxID=298654 RepID=E3ITW2_PSEI1|nr:rod shape-determining protein MreD [Pseudofrankia inefficax]ADP80009.1 rod shape-determining protein MreD [Pseudofrankia inefficax]